MLVMILVVVVAIVDDDDDDDDVYSESDPIDQDHFLYSWRFLYSSHLNLLNQPDETQRDEQK